MLEGVKNMEKINDGLTKNQRYKQNKKQMGIWLNEALYNDFKDKLQKENQTAKEVLEYAINRYLEDTLYK